MDFVDATTTTSGWLMFYVTVVAFFGWTAALAYMNGKKIFWDFEAFPDESDAKH